jgi:hypothetical protein
MRFQINIDCSPEEARKFFGVPDILPLQQSLMEQINEKMADNIKSMDSESLMNMWAPALFQGWSEMQQNFWKNLEQMGSVTIDENGVSARPSKRSKSKRKK